MAWKQFLLRFCATIPLFTSYMCYSTIWGKGKCVIKPIPKPSSLDPRDPLSYRDISLASAVNKIYCRIINSRLSDWVEKTDVLVDKQN